MERRDVLKSAAGMATVSVVGLAGCSGGGGGDGGSGGGGGGGGCSTPDDLQSTLPEGDQYSMNGEAATTEGDSEVLQGSVSAAYTGPNDEVYSYSVTAYSDSQYAQNANTDTGATGEDQIAGYVAVDTHLYLGVGPNKDKVKQFLASSSALEMGCIESNVEWGN